MASGGIGSSKGELRELLKLFLMFSGFSEQSNEERNQYIIRIVSRASESAQKLFWYLLARIFVHVSYLKRILKMLTHT